MEPRSTMHPSVGPEGSLIPLGTAHVPGRAQDRLAALALALSEASAPEDAYRALRCFVEGELPANGLFVSDHDHVRQIRSCAFAYAEGEEIDARTFPPMMNTGSPHSRACLTGETIVTQNFQEAMRGVLRVNVGLQKDPTLPRSSLVIPLKARGHVSGAVEIQSTEEAPFTPDRVATLELAVHLVAATLENVKGLARERSLRVELESRVSERTRQLVAKNRELESFSWTVAHDLRAPLRAVLNYANDLHEDYQDVLDEDGASALRAMAAGSRRMSQLVDDLLHFAAAAQGPVVRELVDITGLARAALDEMQAMEPGRSGTFVVQENLVMEADGALVRVMLTNLLGNAWKYSAKKPSTIITVGMRVQDGERVFFVADEGVGFDAAKSERLFTAFERLHRGEYEGTGIGLSTVQRIVERHGGRIWAEGRPGEGATFSFTLAPAKG